MLAQQPRLIWLVASFVLCLDVGSVLSHFFGEWPAAAAALVLVLLTWRCGHRLAAEAGGHVSLETEFDAAPRPLSTPGLIPWNAMWAGLGAAVARGPRRLAALLLLAYFISTAAIYHGQSPGLLLRILFVAGVGAFVACIARPPAARTLVLLAAVLGVLVRLASYSHRPIDPLGTGDQLPLVLGAIRRFLDGRTPYGMHPMTGWSLPLPYLPGTWLAYLPAHLLGLDIRVTNLLIEIFVPVYLLHLLYAPRRGRAPARGPMGPLLLLVWAFAFVGREQVQWSLCNELPVFWLVLFIVLGRAVAGRLPGLAVGLGLGLATSPLTSVLVPFVLLHVWRRRSFAHGVLVAMAALALAATIVVPFVLWDPSAFALGVIKWHNDNRLAPLERWRIDETWAHFVGFAGLFWRRGAQDLMKPVQILVTAGLLLRYFRTGARAAQLPSACALGLVLFIACNPIVWAYLYWPVGLALLMALAYHQRRLAGHVGASADTAGRMAAPPTAGEIAP